MQLQFLGATREVTGSCYLLRCNGASILIECGLIQGSDDHEHHNHDAFDFAPRDIDAVVVSHAHIDHAGRLPLLVKRGYRGPIHSHRASVDLCAVMLADSAFLQEKQARRPNRERAAHHRGHLEPLYTRDDAARVQGLFRGLEYGRPREIAAGITLTLHDAGHILGSAIVELAVRDKGHTRRLVFSGDLGHRGAPILRDPAVLTEADLVVMESTYGDRLHRPWGDSWREIGEVISSARSQRGNILIPAFTVGRTQELLYAFNRHYDSWGLGDWRVFLDSPMGITATGLYERHAGVYDQQARAFTAQHGGLFDLPNLYMSETPGESMVINRITSGAIIIAGSGMCTGGRITHHLKHNVWREECHVLIVGFQAQGTPGRALVDGAPRIRLWGQEFDVAARIHTIGGLSAHADQQGLVDWYGHFSARPPVCLVHGEPAPMDALADQLADEYGARVTCPAHRQTVTL